MTSRVPEGWAEINLGQVIRSIADGGTPSTSIPAFFGGGIPWVVIDDITPCITNTETTITKLGLKKSSARIWETGTVILSTGATIGKVGIAMKPMATKQGISGIVPTDALDKQYLFYFLILISDQLNSLAQGSTIKEIRPAAIKKIKIALPPLEEQKKIVSVISSVDALIKNLNIQIDKTRNLKKSILCKLVDNFANGISLANQDIKTNVIKLGDYIMPMPKSELLAKSKNENGYYNFYVCSKHVQKSFHADKTDPAILLSTGGEAAVHYAAGKYSYSTDVWAFKLRTKTETKYLHRVLELNLDKVNQLGFQGSGIKHLDKNFIKNMRIILPHAPMQEKITSILDLVDKRIVLLKEKCTKYGDLRQSLIFELLTGKIRVGDTDDG